MRGSSRSVPVLFYEVVARKGYLERCVVGMGKHGGRSMWSNQEEVERYGWLSMQLIQSNHGGVLMKTRRRSVIFYAKVNGSSVSIG